MEQIVAIPVMYGDAGWERCMGTLVGNTGWELWLVLTDGDAGWERCLGNSPKQQRGRFVPQKTSNRPNAATLAFPPLSTGGRRGPRGAQLVIYGRRVLVILGN